MADTIQIEEFTQDRIAHVMEFERELRRQEPDTFFAPADEGYRELLTASFHDRRFVNAISLLAYREARVVGRIDATLIASRSDACCRSAYLDWICVLKNERHSQIAQRLLAELRRRLKAQGVATLIAITAHNEEALRFYRAVENASIHDEAIWMDL